MAGLVEAASELESIARHLRRAGDGELLRELTRAMRDAVGPVPDQIRAGLDAHMPKRYAATLDADLRIGINVRTTGRDPGVSIIGDTKLGTGRGGVREGGKARKLRNLDAGELTHPLFGDRSEWTHAPRQEEHALWFTQREPSVHPGFFTGPARDAAPRVRAGLERALEDVAAKAVSKGA